MTGQDNDLDAAYALRTPADSVRYYRDWAERYDSGFAAEMAYLSPAAVAAQFAALGGAGPVLDVGAGTGLVAQALQARGIGPVDGIDISADMLRIAAAKQVYRRTFRADLTQPLALPDAGYAGCVSAGTFTQGHVGPGAIAELLRVARAEALFVLTVHAAVYDSAGFAAEFARLGSRFRDFATEPFGIYGDGAAGDHAGDRAWLVSFRKV